MSWQTQVGLHLHLQLSSDALSRNDLHEIAKLLKSKSCYIFLDFCGTAFTENDILDVATMLSYSSAGAVVYGLDFSQTSVSTSALTGILPVLDLSNLLHLDLSYTLVSDRFFSEVVTIMEEADAPFPLVSLSLRNCYRLGESDALCAFIARTTRIQTLDLTGVSLQPPTLVNLTDLLYEQEYLSYLSLSNLCRTATSNPSATSSWEGDMRQIIYNILQLPQVQTIDLSGTPIKDIGLYYISQVIDKLLVAKHRFSLEFINLACTGMTDKCVSFLKQILQSMKESSLRSINLIGNRLTVASLEDLRRASTLAGIHLLFDPPLAYYGRGISSRLLERDTQFMDKYSILSLLPHTFSDKPKLTKEESDRIGFSYACNDIVEGALKAYSQNYEDIVPYVLDSVSSSAHELPIAIAASRHSVTTRYVPMSSAKEKDSVQFTNTFLNASEIVYSQDRDTSNPCLDSITYTFSSDDEVSADLLIKKTSSIASQCHKNPDVPSPKAEHVFRSANADTERPLAMSALLSAFIRTDNSAIPVSPFFKQEPKTQPEIPLATETNPETMAVDDGANVDGVQLEASDIQPEVVRSVPITAPSDHSFALAPPFSAGMFVIDESEIVRQRTSEQHTPPEMVSHGHDSVYSKCEASDHVDLSLIRGSVSNSDDGDMQPSEIQPNIQELAPGHQCSITSDSWGSTPPQKVTTQDSPFSSFEEAAPNSDEWSSPYPAEPNVELNETLAEGDFVEQAKHSASVPCIPISTLSISESRRTKLASYMAQTSADPRESKCGFVNKFRVWYASEYEKQKYNVQELLLALDKGLCAAHDCRQICNTVGLTATVNMHASALTVTWFDKLKHKTKTAMLFKDIQTAELVGSGKSGVVHLKTSETEIVVSVMDKAERRLFLELLLLFMTSQS